MSSKHFFADTPGVVTLGLQSLITRNPHLGLDAPNKVVYHKAQDPTKVVLISGGGAGHEPAWSGFTGHGMLGAAVSGEVFASPSAKQIVAAIHRVPSKAGIILCITNYTGDSLHFGLAREKAAGLGYKVGMLRMAEDVGLGRKQTENTGRRGLAGNMFVLKLSGAAAAAGHDFETCMKIGNAVNDNCGTIGSSLDYCHLPGRKHHQQLPPDTYSVAQGIHNEPGLKELSPIPPPEELVSGLLRYLLDPDDPERSYIKYASSDETALLINNFGGMSVFELEALSTITLQRLKQDWSIVPSRLFVSTFESSLNGPGWSISLLNLSGLSRETSVPADTIRQFLDSETDAPAWPKNGYARAPNSDSSTSATRTVQEPAGGLGPLVDAQRLSSALRTASQAVIAAEPDITKWDTIVGDGDCGEAVSAICSSILSKLDKDGLCSPSPAFSSERSQTHLFPVLDAISDSIEDVGGTLGAILAIYAAGLTSALRNAAASSGRDQEEGLSAGELAQAVYAALQSLQGYTNARQGGRTVMDTLIPFATAYRDSGGDFESAIAAAEKGARSTEGMVARFGRASYVGDERKEGIPMDPGAWAAVVFLKGLVQEWTL